MNQDTVFQYLDLKNKKYLYLFILKNSFLFFFLTLLSIILFNNFNKIEKIIGLSTQSILK